MSLCVCVCVCVCAQVSVWVHSHVEEVESYAVEAFAVCVGREGGRAAGGWVLAAVPGQREDQGLESLGDGAPRDLLGLRVLVLLVLGVGLDGLLVRLGGGGGGARSL